MKQKLKKYGLSSEEYVLMVYSQRNKCAICHKVQKGKALAIDHNHSTGKVRGLLCQSCNIGLGHFKDSIDLLINARDYLNKTN